MKKIFSILLLFSSILLFSQNTFTLSSSDLGGQITKKQEFNGFGCSGENKSPHLSWKNIPKGTKSFTITMHDADAPTGSGFWHWIVFNIPTHTTELPSDAGNLSLNLLPKEIIQSITDYGIKGFGGACPPIGHGVHQYTITIHALKVEKLELTENTNPAIVGFNLWMNTLEKASIVSYYKR